MGLNSYVAREPRALPIFILADTSGSMRGEKINELNLALREMLTALNDVDDIRGKFQLCVIGFGGDVNVLQPLADIDGLQLPELNAAGNTPMGEAFDTVREMIEDRNVVSSRAYAPTIVLISDGIPTDCSEEIYHSKEYSKWEPLNNLHSAERSSKSQRLALGIGADADFGMLKEFINQAVLYREKETTSATVENNKYASVDSDSLSSDTDKLLYNIATAINNFIAQDKNQYADQQKNGLKLAATDVNVKTLPESININAAVTGSVTTKQESTSSGT